MKDSYDNIIDAHECVYVFQISYLNSQYLFMLNSVLNFPF